FQPDNPLEARKFLDITKPPLRPQQFRGFAGRRIIKGKAVFFSSYEGLRQFLSLSQSANTLSPNARNGILCANSACTLTTKINIDPRVQVYLPLFPLPNGRINGDTGQFINAAGQIGTENYVTGKLDYQLGANTTLAGSYTFDSANVPTPDVFNEKLKALQTRSQRVILSMQHVFSPA